MHLRTFGLILLAATTAMTGCTSGPVEEETTDDAIVTSDDGLEGSEGTSGWYCRYLNAGLIESALGQESTTPRELVVSDTAEEWICEVLNGGPGEQDPILRVSIQLGQDAVDTARTRAETAEDVQDGPEHLGESYLSAGLVTGLTACRLPTAQRLDDFGPLAIVLESLGQTDATTTQQLRAAASQAAQQLDQSLGCSPKVAREAAGLPTGLGNR